jgi:hypothetical protein
LVKKEGYAFHICLNPFLNILNLGTELMITINKKPFDPSPNIHKNARNNNAVISAEPRQSVVAYINNKGGTCGECYATRLIHQVTKHEVRDEEKDAVDFPSNFTKRNMYDQYCYE